jgi:hypothetical protein
VRLAGNFDSDFLRELESRGAQVVDGRAQAALIFFEAAKKADLEKLPKMVSGLASDGGIWVVYPKGIREIREIEVIDAGRAAGLKDVKVAAFSGTHTALKFVIPVTKR